MDCVYRTKRMNHINERVMYRIESMAIVEHEGHLDIIIYIEREKERKRQSEIERNGCERCIDVNIDVTGSFLLMYFILQVKWNMRIWIEC